MTGHASPLDDEFPLIWCGLHSAGLLAVIPMVLFFVQLAARHYANILLLCPLYSPRRIQLVLIYK